MFDDAKKVIIVTGEKNDSFAELLLSLVSMKEDKKESENKCQIEAVIWNEKQYADNKVELNSCNKIIFIGETNGIKPVMSTICFDDEFSKYGIYYGYMGNRAVIYTDVEKLAYDQVLYEKFYTQFTTLLNETGRKYDDSMKKRVLVNFIDYQKDKKNKTKNLLTKMKRSVSTKDKEKFKEVSDGVAIGVNAATYAAFVPFFWPIDLIEYGKFKRSIKEELKNQQFQCAVIAFYLKKLLEFME